MQGSGTFPSGYRATQLANPNLKWEAATQYNVGLDYTLFGNTLYGTVDAYIKNVKDILLWSKSVSSSSTLSKASTTFELVSLPAW